MFYICVVTLIIKLISYYVKVMTHQKKTLQSFLMTLKAFADCHNQMCASGRRLMYEVNCLFRDRDTLILQKRIYFVPGHSILPDDPGCVESCWIHVLSSSEYNDYLSKCSKYGIETRKIAIRKAD